MLLETTDSVHHYYNVGNIDNGDKRLIWIQVTRERRYQV